MAKTCSFARNSFLVLLYYQYSFQFVHYMHKQFWASGNLKLEALLVKLYEIPTHEAMNKSCINFSLLYESTACQIKLGLVYWVMHILHRSFIQMNTIKLKCFRLIWLPSLVLQQVRSIQPSNITYLKKYSLLNF